MNFRSLAEFARLAPKIVEEDIEVLGMETTAAIAEHQARAVLELTPRGVAPRRAGRRGKGSVYAERLHERWFVSSSEISEKPEWRPAGRSRKLTTASQARSAVKRGTRTVRISNDAPHAAAIDVGVHVATRKLKRGGRSKPVTIGSPQAPRGILPAAEDRIAADINQLRAEAIRRTERRKS